MNTSMKPRHQSHTTNNSRCLTAFLCIINFLVLFHVFYYIPCIYGLKHISVFFISVHRWPVWSIVHLHYWLQIWLSLFELMSGKGSSRFLCLPSCHVIGLDTTANLAFMLGPITWCLRLFLMMGRPKDHAVIVLSKGDWTLLPLIKLCRSDWSTSEQGSWLSYG